MKHFYVWPSADIGRAAISAKAWKAKGYMTCVALDGPPKEWKDNHAYDVIRFIDHWQGYYRHINWLISETFAQGADLVTVGGDDMDPPDQGAQAVADDYYARFPNGFGVMQASGDPQGMDAIGRPAAARICGSPTFGRGWAECAYGGTGAFCAGYQNYYGDEDLKEVAQRLDVLHMQPKFAITHRHWSFGHMQRQPYHERNERTWSADQQLFFGRKAAGFPGHEPLPIKMSGVGPS